jgi:enoyl-CoA hydratase
LNGIDIQPVHRSYRFEQGFTFELNLSGAADEARRSSLDNNFRTSEHQDHRGKGGHA